MPAHSTVKYVEPNINVGLFETTNNDNTNGYGSDVWHPDDGFERAPRLEDYCIALNLEVELCSRDAQGTKDVIILQWGDKRDSVSFMGGTKIGGYSINGTNRTARIEGAEEYLTTYYSDMYVGDLIDYGTTEMIGIKSVDIEYAKSCVPIISIKFTDVRGFSLFQPTELSRTNSYDGIKGINKDNVAQSFFQCFFKMPLPKFTIYIKGFYGKPVAYVMMCDKFETNFNSETGDYDVDTRFIGYSYSFLTDISFDAMLAAPYSDFEGKRYWDEQVNNQRFFLWDKLHTTKQPMPTLYEIHQHFKWLLKQSANEMLDTTLTSEELTHADEIEKLRDIKSKYQNWYQELFNLLKVKYNKRYCFDFRDTKDENSDWHKILILTNAETSSVDNLSEAYKQYSESFKKTNDDLYAAIEDFNNSENNYKKLQNISKDFSKYTRVKLFNDCYVNRNTRKIEFGGFSRECKLNKTEIVNRLFYGEHSDVDFSKINADEINKYQSSLKDFTLSTIYGDGRNQYIDAYLIDVDYSDIDNRIKALNADAKTSSSEKEKIKRRKEHNRLMMSKMNWYPSVENFMKVIMAHIETYMMMMYRVKDECKNRTPEEIGVSIGPDGDACDVNKNSKTLPPFPRVVKKEIGDDNIEKTVDAWVGDYDNGKRFIEADLINGLFNAVDYLFELEKKEYGTTDTSNVLNETPKLFVKHPLTSYDFHLTKNPYGSDGTASNNPNAFAGKVAMRMFNILTLSNFKNEYGGDWSFSNSEFLEKLGEIEAENFNYCVPITNKKMKQMLGLEGGEGTITPESIMQCVMSNVPIGGETDIPWKTNDEKLFDKNCWMNRYTTAYNNAATIIYPMQNMSFKSLDKSLEIFNKGVTSIDKDNQDIMVSSIYAQQNAWTLLKSKNKTAFGNLYVTDNHRVISNVLNESTASPSASYKEIYDLIHDSSVYNVETYKEMISPDGVFLPKMGIETDETPQKASLEPNSNGLYFKKGDKEIVYAFDESKLEAFANEADNRNITSWFFTECRGFYVKPNGNENIFKIDNNKSFFTDKSWIKYIDEASEKCPFRDTVDGRIGFFLMGLDAINYKTVAKELGSNKTFSYIPKLAVLQIGAALSSLSDIGMQIKDSSTLDRHIVLPKSFVFMFKYLNAISDSTRLAYVRYFRDWVLKFNSNINTVLFKQNNNNVACLYEVGENMTRALFREDTKFTQGLTDELMVPVVVTKGNVNHFAYMTYSKDIMFNESQAKSFLNGFLRRLQSLYGVYKESVSSSVKLAAEPNKTTEDMKKDLYRYMKLVYDKWVASMDREEWYYETFFDSDAEEKIRNSGSSGHLFHFIDSYYNKIGDKLLINPSSLGQIIDTAMSSNDVHIMTLGFIADVLSKNKTMLLCLQNFQDLANKDAMDMMFRPISFNAIKEVHKHPDFVVLYPYEPSKYLNVENGEYNNDSFMLNDEFDTPLAIRSRSVDDDKYYQIPAFGVSYGKQYQSYFKKINVGMTSPIATQQSIMAKHAILRKSQDGATQGTVAQDLYDVYSNQSYTCKVEMMGCAWIQPLMYFVLTNVPLFKGSYLILKVTHRITPGDMITEFQGTRMANVSNKLVDEIFTDDNLDSNDDVYITNDRRNALANVDNDCPYRVYPLFGDDNIELTGDAEKDGLAIMNKLIDTYDYNDYAAAGIVGNMYVESYDYSNTKKRFKYDLVIKDSGTSGGLCMWHNGNLIDCVEMKETNLGHNTTKIEYSEEVKNKYSSLLRRNGLEAQLKFLKNTMTNDGSNYVPLEFNKYNSIALQAKSASVAAQKFRELYERSQDKTEAQKKTNQERYDAATKFYNLKKKPNSAKKITPNNQDIYNAFLIAVQKSLESTNTNISIERVDNSSNSSSNYMKIAQKDKGSEKMDLVFDIILNGYYEYVQSLYWVMNESSKDFLQKPSYIEVSVLEKDKVQTNNRIVGIIRDKKKNEDMKKRFDTNANEVNSSLMKSLYKKYKGDNSHEKEIPQFNNFDIFKDIQVENCDTLMEEYYNTEKGITINEGGMIDNWNAKKAAQWLVCATNGKTSQHICAFAVQQAIIAGGISFDRVSKYKNSCNGYRVALNLEETKNWVFVKTGTTETRQISGLNPQIGDIIGMTNGQNESEAGHVCMYCGSRYGWVSDYQQKNEPYPYSGKKGKYWVVRYKGGAKNINPKPLTCFGKKCLNNCSV